jgi:hypothetical protein
LFIVLNLSIVFLSKNPVVTYPKNYHQDVQMQPYHHTYFHQKPYQKVRDKVLRDSFVMIKMQ